MGRSYADWTLDVRCGVEDCTVADSVAGAGRTKEVVLVYGDHDTDAAAEGMKADRNVAVYHVETTVEPASLLVGARLPLQ